MPYKKELSIQPRKYQEEIFKTCVKENCLVVLPTGTGKTLIAIMLAIERFKKFPLKKVLVLAPTRPLVEQHLKSFQEKLPEAWADMQLFTGKTPADKRKKIWQTAEFIFSTPQCIANDLKKNLYALDEVSLLIEDECHRCLKNYSYNFIAQKYKEQSKEDARIVGLTASPGGDKQTIKQVCQNLGISAVEVRTRESDDVKPYLQELEFEKIEVEFPKELEEIRELLKRIYNQKAQWLRENQTIFTYPSKTILLKTQAKIMNDLRTKKDPRLFQAASQTAQALKISHAISLIETQTISAFIDYLKDLYKQASENKSRGVKLLTSDEKFAKAYSLAMQLQYEHPKIQKLLEIVSTEFSKNKNSKIIVFAQFRETVRKIVEALNKIDGVIAKTFVGQAIKQHSAGETTGLNQKDQQKIIHEFSDGKINVLVATSIAEEGLDIPEVNEVVFYETVPSAIRKIQRAGRTARLVKGKLKILITKDTQDEIFHYVAKRKEQTMHKAIDQIKKDLDDGEKQKKLF